MHLRENFSRKLAGQQQVGLPTSIPKQRLDCFPRGKLHHVDPLGAKESQRLWHSHSGNVQLR
jgi:hypothetical protein